MPPLWLQHQQSHARPYAEWWTRRHHCSDVVLGQSRVVDKTDDTVQHSSATSQPAIIDHLKGNTVKLLRSLSIGAILALALAGVAYAYPSGSDANHPENWENQFDVPAACTKYEPGDQSAPGEWYAKDGFIPDSGLVALILKAATYNDVFVAPVGGNLYLTHTGQDISHIIVCVPKEVPSSTPSSEPSSAPSEAPPTPSVEPSTQPSATPSVEPTPTPSPSTSPSETPAPSSTPSTPTPTPTSSTPATPPTVTVTAPPTDTSPDAAPTPSSNVWIVVLVAALGGLIGSLLMARPRRR